VIPSREVQEIASDHAGSQLGLVRKNVLEVWSLLRPPPRLLWAFTNEMLISHAEFSPDDRFLLAACWDASFKPGAAHLLSAQTGQAVVPPLAHRDGVLYATFSPGGERILTCSEDFSALLWETSTGRKLPVAPLLHSEQVLYGAFSESGSWVLTVEKNGTVRVWDAFTAELVLPPLRHSQRISAAQFVREDSRLATRGQDGTVQWWDLSPDTRSLEDLARVAALLTGQEGDLAEASGPQANHEWKADWEQLTSRFPQDFSPPLDERPRK
jgi:WD40 repeat protein